MGKERFFTDEEKNIFFSKYRKLRKSLSETFEKDDYTKMRKLFTSEVATECFGRDKNGINGLIRNVDTALIAVDDMALKRTAIFALILYRPVFKKMIPVETIEKNFSDDIALIISRLLKTSDLYAHNTVISSKNFHRLLFSFAEDVRVILIMIADRLCMMRLEKSIASEKDSIRLSTEV
jgi:GTP pyrophosphokinase